MGEAYDRCASIASIASREGPRSKITKLKIKIAPKKNGQYSLLAFRILEAFVFFFQPLWNHTCDSENKKQVWFLKRASFGCENKNQCRRRTESRTGGEQREQ